MSSPGKILYDTSTTGVAPLSDRAIHHQTIAGHQRETYCMLRAHMHVIARRYTVYHRPSSADLEVTEHTELIKRIHQEHTVFSSIEHEERFLDRWRILYVTGRPGVPPIHTNSFNSIGRYSMSPGGPAFRRSTNSPTAPMSFFEAYCMIRLTTECSVAKPLSELTKEDRRPHTVCSDSIRVLLCQRAYEEKNNNLRIPVERARLPRTTRGRRGIVQACLRA